MKEPILSFLHKNFFDSIRKTIVGNACQHNISNFIACLVAYRISARFLIDNTGNHFMFPCINSWFWNRVAFDICYEYLEFRFGFYGFFAWKFNYDLLRHLSNRFSHFSIVAGRNNKCDRRRERHYTDSKQSFHPDLPLTDTDGRQARQ